MHPPPSWDAAHSGCQGWMLQRPRGHAGHTVIPTVLPVWGGGHNSFPSQTDILWMDSSDSLAAPLELALVIGEFLQRGPHGLDIERALGILMSQLLGMKNVGELNSVCTCKASWKFLGIKQNPSHLTKHPSELCPTCIHR